MIFLFFDKNPFFLCAVQCFAEFSMWTQFFHQEKTWEAEKSKHCQVSLSSSNKYRHFLPHSRFKRHLCFLCHCVCESTRIELDDWMIWWSWKLSDDTGIRSGGNSCFMSMNVAFVVCWFSVVVVVVVDMFDFGCSWSSRGILKFVFNALPLDS